MGGRDRRRRPVGADPVRGHALRARLLPARPGPGGRPDQRGRPDLARPVPGRGRRERARGRRAAPGREAVERAHGGPHAHPHRLRARAGRRRPAAHPHRLAARHAGVPAARDPLRRGRDRRVRRALLGRDGRVRRPRGVAVRLRPRDGDHGPGPPRRARPHRAAGRPAPAGRVRPRPGPRAAADPRADPRPARPRPRPAHPAARRPSARDRGPVHHAVGDRGAGRGAAAGQARRPHRGTAHAGRSATARPLGPAADAGPGGERRPGGLLGRPLARPPQAAARRLGRPAAAGPRAARRTGPAGGAARRRRGDRRGRRGGVPLPRHRPRAAPGLAAAQRLDDGERHGRPAAGPRHGQVVRRRGRPAVRSLAPPPLGPHHPAALVLGGWVRRRGVAALLRPVRRHEAHPVRQRGRAGGRALPRSGRLARAPSAVAAGDPVEPGHVHVGRSPSPRCCWSPSCSAWCPRPACTGRPASGRPGS